MLTQRMKDFLNAATPGTERSTMLDSRISAFMTDTLEQNEAISEEIFFEIANQLEITTISGIPIFYKLRNALIQSFGDPGPANSSGASPVQTSTPAISETVVLPEGFGFGAPIETVSTPEALPTGFGTPTQETSVPPVETSVPVSPPTRRPAAKSRTDALLPQAIKMSEPVSENPTPATKVDPSPIQETDVIDVKVVVIESSVSLTEESVEELAEELVEALEDISDEGGPFILEGVSSEVASEANVQTIIQSAKDLGVTENNTSTETTEGKRTRTKKIAPVASEVDGIIRQLVELVDSKEKTISEQTKTIEKLTKDLEKAQAKLNEEAEKPSSFQLSAVTQKLLEKYNINPQPEAAQVA